jgi:hypothetical protein
MEQNAAVLPASRVTRPDITQTILELFGFILFLRCRKWYQRRRARAKLLSPDLLKSGVRPTIRKGYERFGPSTREAVVLIYISITVRAKRATAH